MECTPPIPHPGVELGAGAQLPVVLHDVDDLPEVLGFGGSQVQGVEVEAFLELGDASGYCHILLDLEPGGSWEGHQAGWGLDWGLLHLLLLLLSPGWVCGLGSLGPGSLGLTWGCRMSSH